MSTVKLPSIDLSFGLDQLMSIIFFRLVHIDRCMYYDTSASVILKRNKYCIFLNCIPNSELMLVITILFFFFFSLSKYTSDGIFAEKSNEMSP